MSIGKKIVATSLLLDQGLAALLYNIRIYPNNFSLKASFWDKVQGVDAKKLIELLFYETENTHSYLNSASIDEWEKYVKINQSAICLFVDYLSHTPIEIIRSAYDEYCRSKNGKYAIPDNVNSCIFNLLQIQSGSLYCPCASHEYLLAVSDKLSDKKLKIFNQSETWAGIKNIKKSADNGNFHIPDTPANVLVHDAFAQLKFDYIIANPPFNSSDWITDYKICQDPRWIYAVPPKSNANFAWLQHIISHLNQNGKAAVILPNSVLSGGTACEKYIRKEIIQSGILSAVITFPRKLFRNTTTAFCLWLLNNSKSDNVLFVDFARLKEKNNIDFTNDTIKILNTISRADSSLDTDNAASLLACVEDIEKNAFDLNPGLYLKSSYAITPATDDKAFDIGINKILEGDFSVKLKESLKHWKQHRNTFVCSSAPLLDLYDVSVGIMANKKRFGRGTELLSVKTIIGNNFVPNSLNDYVETTTLDKQKYSIQKGDVFLNRGSETLDQLACCSVALKSHDAVFSGWAKRLRPKDNTIYPKYAAAYFYSDYYKKQIADNANACTTQFTVNDSVLGRIKVVFPQYSLQRILGDIFYELCLSCNGCTDDETKRFLLEFKTSFVRQAICKPIIECTKMR